MSGIKINVEITLHTIIFFVMRLILHPAREKDDVCHSEGATARVHTNTAVYTCGGVAETYTLIVPFCEHGSAHLYFQRM